MLLRFAFVAAVGVLPIARSQAVEEPRKPDGDATIVIGGTLEQWHNVTLTLNGTYEPEQDNAPNPFADYNLTVKFTHDSGSPSYFVPGYFAADGNAAESSAKSGTSWRAHLSPDTTFVMQEAASIFLRQDRIHLRRCWHTPTLMIPLHRRRTRP